MKFLDVPPHLRMVSIISKLANLFNGLVGDCSFSVQGEGYGEEMRAFVKGREDGFIPRGCFLNWERIGFKSLNFISIGVDGFESCFSLLKKSTLSLLLKRSYMHRRPSLDKDV